jgi:hypothetical protein
MALGDGGSTGGLFNDDAAEETIDEAVNTPTVRELAAQYVSEGGKVRIAELLGVMLSSLWFTLTGGWSLLQREVTTLLIREVQAVENAYAGVISAFFGQGAETIRYSYAVALESAISSAPILAPALFTGQLLVVFSLVEIGRRRVL